MTPVTLDLPGLNDFCVVLVITSSQKWIVEDIQPVPLMSKNAYSQHNTQCAHCSYLILTKIGMG